MFQVNGIEVETLKAVAEVLGRKRVDRKDLAKYGVIEVTTETKAEVTTDTAVISVETETAVIPTETKTEVTTETAIIDITDLSYTEFKAKLRKMTVKELVDAVKAINRDTWEKISNDPIRKMRLIMEMKAGYFPDKAYIAKRRENPAPASPWTLIPTDKLKAKVMELNGNLWEKISNEPILRMRLIMELKAMGVSADSL